MFERSTDSFGLGIDVKPNPATEGGTVTIQGKSGETVYVLGPNSPDLVPVKLDKDGKAEVRVPGKAGESFTVLDGKWPKSTDVVVPIAESIRRGK